ncbi:restriction endonuclease subunit S [Klebsiella michiganensis]|uniref:restriction endonuclease subunit S n=1 Tax=Klebsiella michiganensis TaxID=1134687 RepID=UPI000B49111A|nr:restriction endonuclease subunit S [Klebsiella michiganensis]MDU1357733.1 restriction endonuclease subunit S [Citrobacter freundii]MBZ7434223.1 restriction endonuclease subunit S [Klebsiella michiganensis]MDM4472161.1 restriction endonuclease subunit S [Klebsiella michiganensis]MDU1364761.1 restriction endonuclease subunit S [Klebsiella michiganensis]MDU5618586.1 restriction endonuclease subunit S [Klebsiella michiganensis]
MGSKWERVKIEQLQDNQKGAIAIGPFGSRMKSDCYVPYGIPVVRGTNISSGPNFKGDFVYISPELADTLGSCNVYKNDLIFPHRGSIGEVGIINDNNRYVLSSSMMKLTCDCKKVKPMFLYYFFKSQKGKNELLKNASQVGTPGIAQPLSSLKQIEIELPPLSIQNKIIEIIESLDKKISLNNNLNQILERMSHTLFKSWFVDFDPVIDNALDAGNPIPEALQSRAELRQKVRNSADFKPLPADIRALFPAEFVETELGWVPKGWQTKSMHDLVESVSITFPLSKTDKVIFLNTGDIEKGSFLHQNYSKTEGLPGQAKKSIKKGDILFSEIRPENKRYAFVHFESDNYVVSTKLMVLRAKNEINPLLPYFIITLEDNTKKLQRIAELRSGTFPQITFKELEFISFIMPNNDKIMDLFINSYLAPAYNKIIETKKANINLINLRDTLLPKLISGELSLEDLPNLTNQTEPA